jgi:hypothetical protein
MTETRTGDRPPGRRTDLFVLAVEAVLLILAVTVGAVLNARGVTLHADSAPLFGVWDPHLGWGTPAAVGLAAVVIRWGPGWAGRARWPRLLTVGYLASVGWALSLALVDGWARGLARRLTPQAEYLGEVPKAGPVRTMLAEFTGRILDFQPDSYATHAAGHPPGALLVFVLLDRVGLGGGGPAAVFCLLVGATVAVSVPVALRALGAPDAARAVLPFLVLFPGAVWLAASADAVFTGVVAAGLALLALGGGKEGAPVIASGRGGAPAYHPVRWAGPLAGGLLLGYALFLSYGLVLVAPLAVTVVALRRRDRLRAAALAAVGVGAVVLAFTLAGFWWYDGYQLVVQRYYQGWAAQRPYGYWVWANLAALVLSAGPAVGPALRRAVTGLRPSDVLDLLRPAGRGGEQGPPPIRKAITGAPSFHPERWLAVAAAVAVAAADLSGLSKAEVERIWLPFAVWLLVATARLPAADRRWWLAAQALTALAVNHLVFTEW